MSVWKKDLGQYNHATVIATSQELTDSCSTFAGDGVWKDGKRGPCCLIVRSYWYQSNLVWKDIKNIQKRVSASKDIKGPQHVLIFPQIGCSKNEFPQSGVRTLQISIDFLQQKSWKNKLLFALRRMAKQRPQRRNEWLMAWRRPARHWDTVGEQIVGTSFLAFVE